MTICVKDFSARGKRQVCTSRAKFNEANSGPENAKLRAKAARFKAGKCFLWGGGAAPLHLICAQRSKR